MQYSRIKMMASGNYFNISRFWCLLKMELFRSSKAVLITCVISFGMLFLVDLLLSNFLENTKTIHEHAESYAFTLIIGGFILSSLAFNDLSSTLRRYHYLTLPASNFEKFLGMWLLTSLGWIILFSVTYFIYTVIANEIGRFLFSHISFQSFEPLSEFALSAIQYYFVTQGIFLVGATHFKGYVLPKTVFLLVICGSVGLFIIYFMMAGTFMSEHECSLQGDGYDCELINAMIVHPAWLFVRWLFWWILTPLCWVIAYLALKEKEV